MLSDRTIDRLLSFPTREFGQGATERSIELAEKELDVIFPASYRAFLHQFGWGGVEHIEVYGLGEDVPDYLDLVRITQSERTSMVPPLPSHLVPVANDGAGDHYCLDTQRFTESECPVTVWNHELREDQDPTVVAPEFDTWLSTEMDALEQTN